MNNLIPVSNSFRHSVGCYGKVIRNARTRLTPELDRPPLTIFEGSSNPCYIYFLQNQDPLKGLANSR